MWPGILKSLRQANRSGTHPPAGKIRSEYKELSIDAADIPKEQKHCKDEVVTAVIEGA